MARGMKTKKALLKRIKITSGNKILKRPPHQNHFNAKESGNITRSKRGFKSVPDSLIKDSKYLI